MINITSEIGTLKKVLLHRPGREIENLIPEYLGRLLFDDIPYLEAARIEHDGFANLLKENGVEVFYLQDLLVQSLSHKNITEGFLEKFIRESHITSKSLTYSLMDYLLSMDVQAMIEQLMAGVRRDEIHVKEPSSLIDILDNKYPFYLDPMPNLYFTRDPAAAIGNGLSINSMHRTARKRETLFIECVYNNHALFSGEEVPLWYRRDIPYSVEGGDQLVLSNNVVAIGCSERTSAEAIEIMTQKLFKHNENFNRVLVFAIPSCRAFMHLDTVFTMVDYDKFTIHPGIEGPLNVYEIARGPKEKLIFKSHTETLHNILKNALNLDYVELIRCGGGDAITAGREQWNDGSNTLAIAPGVVVTYNRNYVTNEILSKHGIKVLAIPSSELSRGRGGPRCMSMPLYRKDI